MLACTPGISGNTGSRHGTPPHQWRLLPALPHPPSRFFQMVAPGPDRWMAGSRVCTAALMLRFMPRPVRVADPLQDSSSASSSTSTPGSGFPASIVSAAPPPVETWVILSASPNRVTASAVEPPPVTVVPSRLARVAATRRVPSANSGTSKTPSGRSRRRSGARRVPDRTRLRPRGRYRR